MIITAIIIAIAWFALGFIGGFILMKDDQGGLDRDDWGAVGMASIFGPLTFLVAIVFHIIQLQANNIGEDK